jgi:glucokinase
MFSSQQPIPLSDAQRPFFAGIDVGGTNIKIGLVDDTGRTFAFTSIATQEEKGPEDAIQRISRATEQLLSTTGLRFEDLAAVGLGTPGTMDIPAGMILEPPNMPAWRFYPVRDRLAEACGRPVSFANDAGAAAFGESWVGSGRAFYSIVLLTLGTGVGGGIIIGDLSIDGENSHGAECGHIIIDYTDNARICGCGQRGHLEAYASATALVKRTEEALQAGRNSTLHARIRDGQELSGLMLAEQAEAGDELSREIIMDTGLYLGTGIVTLMHTIDPGAVILGGAMNFGGHSSELGRSFLERVREVVRRRTFPVLAKRTVIDYASLGGDAGYIGAAGIARTAFRRKGGT